MTTSMTTNTHAKITASMIHLSFCLCLAVEADTAEGEDMGLGTVVIVADAPERDRVVRSLLAVDVSENSLSDCEGVGLVTPAAELDQSNDVVSPVLADAELSELESESVCVEVAIEDAVGIG